MKNSTKSDKYQVSAALFIIFFIIITIILLQFYYIEDFLIEPEIDKESKCIINWSGTKWITLGAVDCICPSNCYDYSSCEKIDKEGYCCIKNYCYSGESHYLYDAKCKSKLIYKYNLEVEVKYPSHNGSYISDLAAYKYYRNQNDQEILEYIQIMYPVNSTHNCWILENKFEGYNIYLYKPINILRNMIIIFVFFLIFFEIILIISIPLIAYKVI